MVNSRTPEQPQQASLCCQAKFNAVFTVLTIGAFVLAFWIGLDGHKAAPEHPKPFGLGVGESFIGGSDLTPSEESNKLVFSTHASNVNYMKMIGIFTEEDKAYDTCIGSCIEGASCLRGYCLCNHDEDNPKIPVYGQCWDRWDGFLKYDDDNTRYRKEIAPPIPDYCYVEVDDKKNKGKKKTIISPKLKGTKNCTKITYPNVFLHDNITCESGDHRYCQTKDRNMFCKPEGLCGCRNGMKFNTHKDHMECELPISVDCREEKEFDFVDGDEEEILEMIKGNIILVENKYDAKKVNQTFCIYLDELSGEYNKLREEEFTFRIMGLNMFGFIIFIFGCILLLFIVCNWSNIIHKCIRYSNPENVFKDMDTETKMAAMAALGGREVMDNREERNDELRLTQMQQGGYPVQ